MDDIESGNVAHGADDAVMNAILSDMNAVEDVQAPVYNMPESLPQQQTQYQQAPQYMPQPQPQPQQQPQYLQPEPAFSTYLPSPPQDPRMMMYEPVETPRTQEDLGVTTAAPRKNSWSNLFDEMRDPLVVGFLVCLFSLPALHTWLAKRFTWAYKVGGSLSWLGFFLLFVIVGGLFATYRQIATVMGV